MIDFNDAPIQEDSHLEATRAEIRAELLSRLESVLFLLFPAGKVKRGQFTIGNLDGSPGDSLEVVLTGAKAGLWIDRATNESGDIFDLLAAHWHLHVQTDFHRVLEQAAELLGRAPAASSPPPKKSRKSPSDDDLGPHSALWEYRDAKGSLLAIVYRYDLPGGKKEFRPWDVKRRISSAPTPRPLYNQQGIAKATQVILVEGEKCAQALIDAGFCATTAMHGANAPVGKTNWSPLSGKQVLIWPDRDKSGWAYAENAAQAALAAGAASCHILTPPDDKPEGWDAADALAEGDTFNVAAFLRDGQRESRSATAAPQSCRPDIHVEKGHLHDTAREVCAALGAQIPPVVFQRGGLLNRVSSLSQTVEENGLTIPSGNPIILPLTIPDLVVRIMDACQLLAPHVGRKGETVWLPEDCSNRLAATAAALQGNDWKGIQELVGLSEVPIMRPDGSLFDRVGYDPVSKLYCVNLPSNLAIPLDPSREDAIEAAQRLISPFAQFPFTAATDRSVVLAYLITLALRPLLPYAPLFCHSATAPGSGKGLLIESCNLLVRGREPATQTQPNTQTDDEMRKTITGLLLQGVGSVHLDNFERPVGGTVLNSLLTSPSWNERLLGVNTVPELPTRVTWAASGNNLIIRGDQVRRSIFLNLDPATERPELRQFQGPPLKDLIREQRIELLSALFTLLRAYRQAGCPGQDDQLLGSFEDWSRAVCGPIRWIGWADPIQSQEALRHDDPEQIKLVQLLTSCHEVFGEKPFTVADIIQEISFQGNFAPANDDRRELREAVLSAVGDSGGGQINRRSLGWNLRHFRGRVADGLCLWPCSESENKRTARYFIRRVS
ncbi:hypothetical protein CCP4SC76_5790001 [Gammaproteobacteria bacterium]